MSEKSEYIAGIDESGKGDFFGPLVVAAAAVGALERPLLDELYVRDSKKMTDNRAITVARQLRQKIPHNVVVIMPVRYNELYEKMRNLNLLLSWGHARAVENLLERVNCKTIISDKFGKEELLRKAMMSRGRQVELIQQVRGEENLAVAAASILARAEFLQRLQQMSRHWKMTLPKGASSAVDAAGGIFAEKWGEDKLREVAKLHFKNRQKLRRLPGKQL